MENIFKQIREMKVGDTLDLPVATQSEELRRARIFAEVAGWVVMSRSNKEDKSCCMLTRVS